MHKTKWAASGIAHEGGQGLKGGCVSARGFTIPAKKSPSRTHTRTP